jgi:hypothetical protein
VLDRIKESARMIFGLRDRYSETAERVEASSHQHRKEATAAIDSLNELLKELATRNPLDGGKND